MTQQSTRDAIAQAIVEALISPNVSDSNYEAANVVDVIDKVARAIYDLAEAIREVAQKLPEPD